jgi:hypothetical protein
MKKLQCLFVFIILFVQVVPCLAETENKFTKNDVEQIVKRNSLDYMEKDSSMMLLTLNFINNGKDRQATELFEYKLDIAVCEGWENIDATDDNSHNRILNILRDIKKYRINNPRKVISLSEVKEANDLFADIGGSNVEYAEMAKQILGKIN